MFVAATGAYKSDPDFFTFPIYLLTKDLTKNFGKKFGGSPYFSPSKKVAQENDPTMPAYDPHFYHRICFSYKNVDVCKKNQPRAQYLYYCPF